MSSVSWETEKEENAELSLDTNSDHMVDSF